MSRFAIVATVLATALAAAPAASACDACTALEHDLHLLPGIGGDSTASSPAASASASFSLSVPIYHSLPSAPARIYLDFDGDVTAFWGTYSPGTTPAYSTDADTSSFSAEELTNIHDIWARVAEKYSPFNIDVTTEDPGTLNDLQSIRVVIGGDGMRANGTYWPGAKAGGIGYIGGFYNFNPNTVYVFPGNLGNGTPKYTAEAAAHEAGHSFGLQHQSTYDASGNKTAEYSIGVPGVKAPLMGRPYEAERGLWWSGPSVNSSFIQDDVGSLTSSLNGFFYRPDEHGNTLAAATPLDLSGGSAAAQGVITRTTDVDFFSFHLLDDAWVNFIVTGSAFGGMLDPSLALYSSQGQLLGMQATASLSEALALELPAGDYGLSVASAGNYGDIGQFFLTVTVGIPEPASTTVVLCMLLVLRRRS